MNNPNLVPNQQSGRGRPKGSVNRATQRVREAIAMIVENNLANLQGWIERVAIDDPKGACRIITDLCDFYVPRLARQEVMVTQDDGNDLRTMTDAELRARMKRVLNE